MSADEKDVTRALQNTGKEFGKVRDAIANMATASKEAGTVENQIAQQRMAALNPLVAKQKELRAALEESTKQLKDGKITADQHAAAVKSNAEASDQLTQKLKELQVQIAEDTNDFRKAATVIGQVEDKTEKYARAVAELDRYKAKGIITSKQHAAALDAEKKKLEDVGGGADKSGGLISGLTQKMGQFVAGLAGGSAIIATIRQEYDALIERQGKSADANIQLGAVQENLINNGADADVLAKVRKLAKSRGIKEEVIAQAVTETLSARGDMTIGDVTDAVGSVSKVKRLGTSSEMAGLGAAVLDTRKQTGLGTDAALGFLFQMQDSARTKSLNDLATNITPAIGGVMKLGADRSTAGALLASLSHGMGDATGANTATAGLSLADQLRKFAPGQDLGKTIASLQGDAQLRQQFLSGASFEIKAKPAIEGLLSGQGAEARNFAAFQQSLAVDPTSRLRKAESDRKAAGSITVAETKQAFDSAENRFRVDDKEGATSAIVRESMKSLRDSLKKSRLESNVAGLVDDVLSNGTQSLDDAIGSVSGIRDRQKRSAYSRAVSDGAVTQDERQRIAYTDGLLKELVDQLKGLRSDQKGQQQQNVHAGAVAGRRNNQGEGAP